MSGGTLEILERWLVRRREPLESLGITTSITRGPAGRDPDSAWVDFSTRTKSARLIVWSSGLADLTVGDFIKGEVLLDEHREILTDMGFDEVEVTVRALLLPD
jgi:hypothetical protein